MLQKQLRLIIFSIWLAWLRETKGGGWLAEAVPRSTFKEIMFYMPRDPCRGHRAVEFHQKDPRVETVYLLRSWGKVAKGIYFSLVSFWPEVYGEPIKVSQSITPGIN